jgi:hypothetical protein
MSRKASADIVKSLDWGRIEKNANEVSGSVGRGVRREFADQRGPTVRVTVRDLRVDVSGEHVASTVVLTPDDFARSLGGSNGSPRVERLVLNGIVLQAPGALGPRPSVDASGAPSFELSFDGAVSTDQAAALRDSKTLTLEATLDDGRQFVGFKVG